MVPDTGRRRSRASVASLWLVLSGYAAGALALLVYALVLALDATRGPGALLVLLAQVAGGYAVSAGALGVVVGAITLVRVWASPTLTGSRWSIAAAALGGLLLLPVVSLFGLVVWALSSGAHGRPLRVGRRARVAGLRPGRRRERPTPRTEGLDPGARARLASAWAANALADHASVAAFDRLEAELRRAGGPEELLAACRAARAEEVDHAERCFALASAYAGVALDAGPLPDAAPREVGPAALAVESLVDGCLQEGFSAALAALAELRARDPAVRATLAVIAADEAAHAALSERIVDWAVAAGGAPVAEAVREAASRLPERAPEGAVRVAGLIGDEDARRAWAEVRSRVQALAASAPVAPRSSGIV